jgi:hypothetical protein
MDVTQALLQLRPGAQWSIPAGSTNANEIIWHDDTTPVTQNELDAMMSQPVPELTPVKKLERSGLTVNELKELLGLEVTP